MIAGADGRYRIDGPITMNNANGILEEGLAKFGDAAEVDLAALGEVDSAAVSLLLEWRRANPALKFTGCPANLKSLVTLYGVLELVQ